ncbi:MAG TPA: hypothetical protein PKH72_00125 [Rhodoferax sp.]|jgi:hypothetical protein|nr:hypothetical protein [Rhodoferax sp.]HNV58034.1 hypothetical protein [Rhodoferax sp.]
MVDITKNEWFKTAQEPFTDIAFMLIELNRRKLLPDDMRQAIFKHAENSTETLPRSIAAIASTLAGAVAGDVGADKGEIEGVSWGIAGLAEQAHGWNELAGWFRPEAIASQSA